MMTQCRLRRERKGRAYKHQLLICMTERTRMLLCSLARLRPPAGRVRRAGRVRCLRRVPPTSHTGAGVRHADSCLSAWCPWLSPPPATWAATVRPRGLYVHNLDVTFGMVRHERVQGHVRNGVSSPAAIAALVGGGVPTSVLCSGGSVRACGGVLGPVPHESLCGG